MQVATKPVATIKCESCGKQTIRTVMAKDQHAVVLNAEVISEKKAVNRYRLTDKGAQRVNYHDQLCGDPGHTLHICGGGDRG